MQSTNAVYQCKIFTAFLLAAALMLVNGAVEARQETARWGIGAGVFQVLDNDRSAALRLGYYGEPLRFGLRPLAGVLVNADQGAYGYAGLGYSFWLSDKLFLMPSFSVGAYRKGDGKDLGGVVEFQSALEVGYSLSNLNQISIGISHLSNAGIYDDNPGAELVWVNYALSF